HGAVRTTSFPSTTLFRSPPLAAGASPSSLTVWDLFSGGDGVLMDQLIRDVSRGPDGFDVDRTILEWGFSYYTKLAMSAAGGRAPDRKSTRLNSSHVKSSY